MADNLSPEYTEDLLSTLAGRRATTTIDAEDAAVRDHLVHDVPVLPGVFLLDLVLRLVGRAGVDPAAVQLRRVTFLAPVLGTAEGRRIDVEIGPGGTGRLPVTVRSRPAGSDGAWETNCRAEIHPAAREPRPGRVDHVVLEAAGTEVVDVEDLYGLARRIEIRHRGFMKATGLVHVGRDHALARMRVAAEAEPYLERFHAHPAVLDFATLVPMLLLRQDRRADADHAFIPIYVDSFHATSGVGAENLVHVPGPVTGRLDGELFEADLEVCSLDGTVVARLGGFRAKRVRSADLITHRPPQTGKQRDGATTPSHAAADTPRPRAGGLRETVEALVAAKLGLDPDEIDPDRGFYDLGLNSLDLLGIADALEDGLSTELYPTLLFEYPTVRSLVDHLGGIGLGAPVQEETAPTAPVTAPPPARRPSAASPAGEEGHREPVAIVGMAGRYPGAATAEDLWEVLRDGVDQVTGVPRERWDDTAQTGAFCAGVADFDASFFHLSAEQALTMDPHERLLLQTAWEALENAGHTPEGLAEQTGGAVGVFAGAMWNDYQLTGLDRWRGGGGEIVGSWSSALTNRISYAFDFEGPSVTVDTACSASLAALHLAVQSIRRGECRAALAGGVNLSLHPYKYLRLGELGLLSESGRCRPFDAEADGYVPGEGVGVVVLRPLADALASGDRVLGIVRGSALRHSGRTGGYTVPSPDAQAKVISAALTDADATADTVGYVEAHASSTTLGDRIEVEALTSAYRQHGAVTPGACAIGSAKGTIGHLEAASGMAALAKVLLALRHRTIPAGPGIGRPNPGISFDGTPFRLPAHEEPWAAPVDPATGAVGPRRAALSTFGAGGANVHLVVEEFTQAAPPPPAHGAGQPRTVPLSARTEDELRRQAHRLAVHLRAAAGPCLDDVAHTLRAGRRPMEHRLAVVVRDLDELAASLQDFADGRAPGSPLHTGRVRPGRSGHGVAAPDEAALAGLWVGGELAAWPVIEGAGRVPLPTYPFTLRRYWLAPRDTSTAPVAPAPSADAVPSATDTPLLYAPRRLPEPLPAESGSGAFADAVVIALDTDDARVAELRTRCRRVVRVQPGMAYARTGPDSFEVRPGDEEHAFALAADLRAEGAEPSALLHLWAWGRGEAPRAQDVGGLLSLFPVCRAWALGRTAPLALIYAYPCAQENPPDAAVGGFARSVRLEQPKLALRTVGFGGGRVDMETLLREAADALADRPGRETESDAEVRYAGGERTVTGFVPVSATASGDRRTDRPVLARTGGTYMISGGAGALGLHTARFLARTPGVAIVLTGRSPSGPGTEAAVAELEGLGARAAYLSCDLTDRDAARVLVREITERFGRLTGVIHAAGVVEDALLVNKTAESFRRVLAPKITGTVLLDAATEDQDLDYFLLYSSVASVVGNAGASDYAAANRYLDAFADWREDLRRSGRRAGRTLAVNWPLWRDGGMRVDPSMQDKVLARIGARPLETLEGLVALERALAADESRVVVLCGDRELLERRLGVTASRTQPGRDVTWEELLVTAESSLEELVLGLVPTGAGPGHRSLGDTGFMELGLSSVQVVDLVRRLSERLGVDLQPTLLFRHSNVSSLARYLTDTHPDAVRELRPARGETAGGADRGATAVPERAGARPRATASDDLRPTEQPIAVIGMAGRFPGAANPSQLWDRLVQGHDLVSEVPADRWDHREHHDPTGTLASGTDCGHGAFLDDVTRFDAAFFGVRDAEARGMDPQSRLLLEVLYEAAEDAGVAGTLRGTATGMFVGRCFSDYEEEMARRGGAPGAFDVTGTSVSMAANRASYAFDLSGPSMVVDTACSSSLYALHLAVNALRSGQCAMAYAAGTNLILSPQHYLRSSALGALSPSGRCHTFDARADGYVPGEAVTAVLLKPLDRAIEDGDPVHAVIKAVAVSHGGNAASVTAPQPARQSELLAAAWQQAGIAPGTLSYLEAHGTGTALGDPVEFEAASTALRPHTDERAVCAVGSAKAHLGHTEAAAGLVGVVKTILSLRNELIPAMPAFETPNPGCHVDAGPLFVNREPLEWKQAAGTPRRAGVSSFGFGGAYAHAVIEEAPARSVPRPTAGPVLLPFAAKDETALRELVRRHRDFLAERPDTRLDRVAATLRRGREHLPCRLAVFADSMSDLLRRLGAYADATHPHDRVLGEERVRASDPETVRAAAEWARGNATLPTAPAVEALPRLSLPTYPFAGDTYWFDEATTAAPRTPPRDETTTASVIAAVDTFVSRSGFRGVQASRGMDRLDALLRRWSRHLLGGAGDSGAPTPRSLRTRLADETRYGRLADALALMIARAPATPHSRPGTPEESAWLSAEAAALADDHPELRPWVDVVTGCVPRLPDILAGEADPLEVYFAEAQPDLLLRVYDGNAVADHHNEIVARTVAGQVRALLARRPGRPVRLLEIGGGTGGTTRRLLDALGDVGTNVSFVFTDVSPGFLPAARRRFAGGAVAFECRVLDLDSEPEAQGFGQAAADIVIAANSVHATRSIADSLARVRRLLAPGGLLVLEELVRNRDCMTAMIGALPGYWSSVDADVRLPHSPFLDVAGWRRAMREQGFSATWALGAPDLAEAEFDNAVMIGEVPAEPQHPRAATAPVPTVAESPRPEADPLRPRHASEPVPPATVEGNAVAATPERDVDAVRTLLRAVFARFFGMAEEDVDSGASFDAFGMDSLSAIQLVRTLEPDFGKLPKVLLYEHATIDSLAEHLARHATGPEATPDKETRESAERPANEELTAGPAPRAGARAESRPAAEPLAIVGMAGRFARSPDLATWWRHLRDGVHLVSEIPAERFDWREFFGDPHRDEGKVNSRWGSFIEGVDRFDADFFAMTPLEAELMDPQQRIMLETAWKAVEDSGHRPSEIRGSRTGVFVGATSRDYDWLLHRAGRHREGHVVSGSGHCLIANRVSHQLDLRGPSEAVDTACSSSLTALHRAVRAVRGGECDSAIVGGVHLFLTPDLFVALGQLGIISPDGRCAAFDRRANGMVRGEGAVAVVIKPLSRALADGDTVHALIRGSGVSHGGGDRRDSLMMPNPTAQAELIASVHRDAAVDPRTITYIEAHGTGTEVGDPIEVRGLRKAFAAGTGTAEDERTESWCALGTVKSNVGHTEAAAGLTGVVKTVLAMRAGALPPTLHFTEANPLLDLEGSPFRVVDRLTPWQPPSGLPRRAGVSAFGLGGTNAHVLLEDYPQSSPAVDAAPVRPCVVPLSARTDERLTAYAGELHDFLEDLREDGAALPPLTDIAYTLTVGRDPMASRLAVVATTAQELTAALRAHLDGVPDPRVITGTSAGTGEADGRSPGSVPRSAVLADAVTWVTGGTLPPPPPGRRTPLPTYPFEPQRHWAGPTETAASGNPPPAAASGDGGEETLPDVLQALSEGRVSVEHVEQFMEGVL